MDDGEGWTAQEIIARLNTSPPTDERRTLLQHANTLIAHAASLDQETDTNNSRTLRFVRHDLVTLACVDREPDLQRRALTTLIGVLSHTQWDQTPRSASAAAGLVSDTLSILSQLAPSLFQTHTPEIQAQVACAAFALLQSVLDAASLSLLSPIDQETKSRWTSALQGASSIAAAGLARIEGAPHTTHWVSPGGRTSVATVLWLDLAAEAAKRVVSNQAMVSLPLTRARSALLAVLALAARQGKLAARHANDLVQSFVQARAAKGSGWFPTAALVAPLVMRKGITSYDSKLEDQELVLMGEQVCVAQAESSGSVSWHAKVLLAMGASSSPSSPHLNILGSLIDGPLARRGRSVETRVQLMASHALLSFLDPELDGYDDVLALIKFLVLAGTDGNLNGTVLALLQSALPPSPPLSPAWGDVPTPDHVLIGLARAVEAAEGIDAAEIEFASLAWQVSKSKSLDTIQIDYNAMADSAAMMDASKSRFLVVTPGFVHKAKCVGLGAYSVSITLPRPTTSRLSTVGGSPSTHDSTHDSAHDSAHDSDFLIVALSSSFPSSPSSSSSLSKAAYAFALPPPRAHQLSNLLQ